MLCSGADSYVFYVNLLIEFVAGLPARAVLIRKSTMKRNAARYLFAAITVILLYVLHLMLSLLKYHESSAVITTSTKRCASLDAPPICASATNGIKLVTLALLMSAPAHYQENTHYLSLPHKYKKPMSLAFMMMDDTWRIIRDCCCAIESV